MSYLSNNKSPNIQLEEFGKEQKIPSIYKRNSCVNMNINQISSLYKTCNSYKKNLIPEENHRGLMYQNNTQSKYLKDQMFMIEKVKKSNLISRLFNIQ